MLRYGIIGIGAMGREHAENLSFIEGASVTAISDPDSGSRDLAIKQLGESVKVFTDHRQLLDSGLVDVVIIATPNFTHVDILEDVLKTSLHVFIEKPLCTTIDDCLKVIEWSKNRSGLVWMGLEYRYMPPVAELISIVHGGGVGQVQQVSIREHREPFYPKVGNWNRFTSKTGGTLVEKCCHYFNLMDHIAKERPTRVFASGGQRVNYLDESYEGVKADMLDSAYVILEYPSGTRAMLDLCMFAENTVDKEHISVTGSEGKVESFLPSLELRYGKRSAVGNFKQWSHDASKPKVESRKVWDESIKYNGFHYGASYLEHLKFFNAIKSGKGPDVSLEDGLRSVASGLASQMSIAQGRPVSMSEVLPAGVELMSSCTLIPLARPTFDVSAAQKFFDSARDLLSDIGATVNGPRSLVMTPEDTASAEANLKSDEKLYILFNASFADASAAVSLLSKVSGDVLLWSVREFGEIGDRLLLNSMCGSNLAAHALRVNGKRITHLHGNPDEAHVRDALSSALSGKMPDVGQPQKISGQLADLENVKAALSKLNGLTIGAIGDAPAGFTPCTYDEEALKKSFGLNIINKSIPEIFADIAAVPLDKESAEYQDACQAQPSLKDVPEREARVNASTRVALDNWIRANDLSAIAMRCWPDFAVDLGACPCGAMGRTATSGTPAACERDVYGAVTMLLLEALGSGTNYLVDTVDLEEDENIIRIWHCGSAATTLAVDPDNATQFIHCNRKLGVAGNFPLKTGPVVLVRLDTDIDPANQSKLRLVMTSGESLSAPNRFQGNTATVRTSAPARQLINGLIHNGFPHHTVVAWKDIRAEVRRMAEYLAIPLTEW